MTLKQDSTHFAFQLLRRLPFRFATDKKFFVVLINRDFMRTIINTNSLQLSRIIFERILKFAESKVVRSDTVDILYLYSGARHSQRF